MTQLRRFFTFLSKMSRMGQRHLPAVLTFAVFGMFVLGYFESFRWPFPPPKATHGFLKGLLLFVVAACILYRSRLKSRLSGMERLVLGLFIGSFVVSSVFSLVPETSFLFLWYPFIGGSMMYVLSCIRLKRGHIMIAVVISMLLILVTFSFAFISLLFRYEVINLYYFLFLESRAGYLVDQLQQFGKYVGLGPYFMLLPLSMVFLVERKSSLSRRALAGLVYAIALCTAVISNNRIDIVVIAIETAVMIWIIPRRLAVILLILALPVAQLGLMTSERYFGFNLEDRLLRPNAARDIESVEIRFTYWENALRNFRLHPFFGTGPNTYNDITDFPYRQYYDPGVRMYTQRQDVGIGVHNLFLERLSDTGIVGLFSFVALLLYFAKKDVMQAVSRRGERRAWYLLLALSAWSWILYGITDNGYGAQGFVTFFFLRGLMSHI